MEDTVTCRIGVNEAHIKHVPCEVLQDFQVLHLLIDPLRFMWGGSKEVV